MRKAFVYLSILFVSLPMHAAVAGEKVGTISAGGVARGAHFRIRYIVPLHGNFANYDRVEIAKLESALGDVVPRKKMDKFANNLKKSFERMGLFSQVEIVDSFVRPDPASSGAEEQAGAKDKSKGTLVITGKVIDYARGSRALRLLGLGLSPSIFTVRFSIFDKDTGQELARGNISGVVQDGFLSIPGFSSDEVSFKEVGVAISDQVERRTKAALQ